MRLQPAGSKCRHTPNQAAGAPVELTIFFLSKRTHAVYLPLGYSALGEGVGTIDHKGLAAEREALAVLYELWAICKDYIPNPHVLRVPE